MLSGWPSHHVSISSIRTGSVTSVGAAAASALLFDHIPWTLFW